MSPELRTSLEAVSRSIHAVGSRATCNPAPTGTDEDWLVYAPGKMMEKAIGFLSSDGWKLDNPNEHYRPEQGAFNSWRKGEINLIVTGDHGFRRRFLAASEVAKQLNLMEKAQRVLLFQAVLYGNGAPAIAEEWA